MDKVVSFELAKFIKEKGFKSKSRLYYDGSGDLIENPNIYYRHTNNEMQRFRWEAPTMAEVIMWLYEEHKIWILIIPTVTGYFAYKILDVQLDPENIIERPPYKNVSGEEYSHPTESYEWAIKYVLENLL